jgi:hypothetical protein
MINATLSTTVIITDNADTRNYNKMFLPPILSLPMTPVPAVSWLAAKQRSSVRI